MKIKLLNPHALTPKFGTKGAGCFDLYTAEDTVLKHGIPTKIPTGIAFEVPEGFCMPIYSRSSTALKQIICTPLIVDSDYRGEVFVTALYMGEGEYHVKRGDRIAQGKLERLEPTTFEVVETLSETERGTGGYGSTGR